jgi:hypothetical protein
MLSRTPFSRHFRENGNPSDLVQSGSFLETPSGLQAWIPVFTGMMKVFWDILRHISEVKIKCCAKTAWVGT